jgi:hypothetical protein
MNVFHLVKIHKSNVMMTSVRRGQFAARIRHVRYLAGEVTNVLLWTIVHRVIAIGIHPEVMLAVFIMRTAHKGSLVHCQEPVLRDAYIPLTVNQACG